MLLEEKKLLLDIQVAVNSINEYLGESRDFNAFQKRKMLRRAVERELEIIGEATNKLLKLNPDISISEARRIVNLRNWVIHAYDSVDYMVIWGIVNKDIPLLKSQVDKLLVNM